MNEHCAEHLATLLRLVERGEEIPTALKAHLATCSECARLLDAMNRMYSDIDAPAASADESVVAQTLEQSAGEVERSNRTRNVMRAVTAFALILGIGWLVGVGMSSPTQSVAIISRVLLVIVPLALIIALGLAFRDRLQQPGRVIYKRVKPGRVLSGVCLGLAESLRAPVFILRIVFIAFFFIKGIGLWIYLLLMLLLPLHPDDRQYLWRFRIVRAFRRED
jgi:phage shock protein PspC (stress-responsive transcriptional regulator)